MESHLHVGIYIGCSQFHVGSVSLVLNPETSHVSHQFHVVFDDKFSTVTFMREDTMPSKGGQIWYNLAQKVVNQRKLTSRILRSLQILGKIWAKPKSWDESCSKERHIVAVRTSHTKILYHRGRSCIWSDRTSGLQFSSKHIRFKWSLLRSTNIQCAQWDSISRGRKGIKNA